MQKIGKKQWRRSEAKRFSGGFWALWDEEMINLKLLYAYKYFMHTEVKSEGGICWVMTTVYASHRPHLINQLREKINANKVRHPWVLLSDFKCVFQAWECSSGTGVSSSFVSWVRQRGLIDLGFTGPQLTWSHGSTTKTRKETRLDRELCDDN